MTSVVAVTGAGGFFGRALLERLASEDVDIRAISRRGGPAMARVRWVPADVRDRDALIPALRGVDVVFHLAAHVHDLGSTDDSAQQQAVTLGGTVATLGAAERAGVGQVVLASSLAVFGPTGGRMLDESDPCRPDTPYGKAKLQAEAALVDFTTRTGALGASIRPAMMYGVPCPGNLPRMIRALAEGWFPPLPEFGNRRSMVHVADAAEAMVLAWRARIGAGRPYIIIDGQGYSTREIQDMIRAALGRPTGGPVIPRPLFTAAARAGDLASRLLGRRVLFDSNALDRIAGSAEFSGARARTELGFAPSMRLPTIMPALVRATLDAAATSRTSAPR